MMKQSRPNQTGLPAPVWEYGVALADSLQAPIRIIRTEWPAEYEMRSYDDRVLLVECYFDNDVWEFERQTTFPHLPGILAL